MAVVVELVGMFNVLGFLSGMTLVRLVFVPLLLLILSIPMFMSILVPLPLLEFDDRTSFVSIPSVSKFWFELEFEFEVEEFELEFESELAELCPTIKPASSLRSVLVTGTRFIKGPRLRSNSSMN
jgi:hypothetical protein